MTFYRYERSQKFQEALISSQFGSAGSILDSSKQVYSDRNRLLYLLQKGTVLHLLEEREESNSYFEDVQINYYKAINYLADGNLESAPGSGICDSFG